jgi:alpha-amylase
MSWPAFERSISGFVMSVFAFCGIFSVQAKADVIWQAHNMRFSEIEKMVPELASRSITHIQVSPAQKSHPSPAWWARYQPVDFSLIEGPLGTEAELASLIREAHRYSTKIVVDVVFNHMANIDDMPCTLRYPQFLPQDFHGDCKSHKSAADDTIRGWLGNDLPDLRTESPRVRKIAKAYLRKLMDIGVDGFRFDAAGHIEPEFFADMVAYLKPHGKMFYGEVLVHYNRIAEAWAYTPYLSVTDYPLMARIFDAFSYGGDLRILKWPAAENKALQGVSAVTFVNNHDIHEHPWDFSGLALDVRENEGLPSDAQLAHGYILGRQEGFPMIFRSDLFDPIVTAGVQFHEKMMGEKEYMRAASQYHANADNPNLLFIERGSKGLVVINKSQFWFEVPEMRMPGFSAGCFRELRRGFVMELEATSSGARVSRWGNEDGASAKIGPRDVLFFVKEGDSPCQ